MFALLFPEGVECVLSERWGGWGGLEARPWQRQVGQGDAGRREMFEPGSVLFFLDGSCCFLGFCFFLGSQIVVVFLGCFELFLGFPFLRQILLSLVIVAFFIESGCFHPGRKDAMD